MNDFLPKLKEKLLSFFGWFFAVLFGVVFVYALFDDVKDDLSMIIVCFLFALLGVFMIYRSGKMKAARYSKAEALEKKAEAQIQKKEAEAEELKYITVVCKHCGATSRIKKGTSAKCEYCDCYLEY